MMKQLERLTYEHRAKVYLSIGDKENEIKDKCEGFTDKNEIMKCLVAEIAKHANIKLKFEVFPDQNHSRATIFGLIKGMEYIFKKD
jgi:hypothetical protein